MPKLTAGQANELANQFLAIAQAIGNFRYKHWDHLSKAQHRRLASQHASILTYGEDILALSTTLIMEDSANALVSIKTIVGKLKSSLKTLADIKKGIDLVADIVTLGAAIVDIDPAAIGESIEDLITDL